MQRVISFGQPGEIGCQLQKDAIGLNAADNGGDCLTGLEPGGVFLPGAQQLLEGHGDAARVQVLTLEDHIQFLPHVKPVAAMADAGNRDVFQRQQCRNAAAYVAEHTEGGGIGHHGGQNVAGLSLIQQMVEGVPLDGGPGQDNGAVVGDGFNAAADGLTHPAENGDFPDGALSDAQGRPVTGDDGGEPAQGQMEIVVLIAPEGGDRQHSALFHPAAQLLQGHGVQGRGGLHGLRQIRLHRIPPFVFPILCRERGKGF